MTRTRGPDGALAMAVLLAATLVTPSVSAAVPECRGRPATIVGTNGSDRLIGTSGDDVIYAGRGNDVIRGMGGDDRVCGGLGRDFIKGDAGNDVLVDRDTPSDALHDKLVYGGPGDDLIDTARGARVWGGSGADDITANIAHGGNGDDRIRANQIEGGAGDDALIGVGRYTHTWYAASPRGIRVLTARGLVLGHGRDTLKGIRFVDGSNHDDEFFGTAGEETFGGASGNDVFHPGAGDDTVYGGNGDDVVRGGAGRDFLQGYAGDDLVLGGDGADYITSRAGTDRTFGGRGNDYIDAGPGSEVTHGGPGNDKINGGWGGPDTDVVLGGDGHDLLTGGDGDDELRGGAGVDLAYFEGADKGVTASLETGIATARRLGEDTMYSLEGLVGTIYGDTLEGNDGHNVFDPGPALYAGSIDVVNGYGGDDLVLYESYGSNSDHQDFDAGPGSDWISYEVDREFTQFAGVSFESSFENVIGGPRPSQLFGSTGDNILIGGDKNDLLDAGDEGGDDGGDVLVGFGGQDECVGGDRIHSCEESDGGVPLKGMERPAGCALAGIGFVPTYQDARGLSRFCRLL